MTWQFTEEQLEGLSEMFECIKRLYYLPAGRSVKVIVNAETTVFYKAL